MRNIPTYFPVKTILLLTAFFAILSCSGNPKVTRIGSDTVTDLSGRWSDTDSRMVSQKMTAEMLEKSWYKSWEHENNARPSLIVGRIRNETMEHINTGAFIADIEHSLINSGKITFVAGNRDRDDVRRERLDQLSNASEETIKEFGREIGADFMLFGTIISFTDQAGGTKAVTYQIDMYLVDIEKNLKVWAGQEKIKKLIKRKKLKF